MCVNPPVMRIASIIMYAALSMHMATGNNIRRVLLNSVVLTQSETESKYLVCVAAYVSETHIVMVPVY